MLFCSVGFFGLDQVGVELEGPFGVDANDLPLLAMGASICDDLDTMKRTVDRRRVAQRTAVHSLKKEGQRILKAAQNHLQWGAGAEAPPQDDDLEETTAVSSALGTARAVNCMAQKLTRSTSRGKQMASASAEPAEPGGQKTRGDMLKMIEHAAAQAAEAQASDGDDAHDEVAGPMASLMSRAEKV